MNKILFIIVVLIFVLSCSKDADIKNENGVIISKSPLWTTATTDDDSLTYAFLFKEAFIHKNSVLIKSRKSKKEILRCLNVNDGSVKWDWGEFFENSEGILYPYKYQDKIIWQERYYNYCVDLNTGTTVWKNASQENYERRSFGVNDIFTVSHLINRNTLIETGGNIVVMNSKTGKSLFSFKPKYDTTGIHSFDNCGWGYMGFPSVFTKNGDEYILIKFNDPPPSCQLFGTEWLGLYNYSKKEWVYERQKLKSVDGAFGTSSPPIIFNDKIYSNPNNGIVCHDLMTGNKLWETAGTSSTASIIKIDNGYIYVSSEGGLLTCLNANSGSVKWSINPSGTRTAVSILNGVVYFVGSDGKLYAIEAETGKYLWKIDSPDRTKNKWALFLGMCSVVQVGSEKGRIVVTTGLNAYCYEAIR